MDSVEKHLTRGHGPADQWKHSPTGRRAHAAAVARQGKAKVSGRSGNRRKSGEKVDPKGKKVGTAENPIKVKSASRALELMAAGKHVVMDKETVGVVLSKLAKIGQEAFEAEKRGESVDLPDYDLCRVHVPDSNLFCVKNKNIPRIKMPQVKGKNIRPGSKAEALLKKQNEANGTPDNREVDATDEFVSYLKDQGVTISKGVPVDASKLKATQNQLVGSKVGGMMAARQGGKFDPAKDPIFVSTDNYVLDGHHRWAAVVGSEFAEGKSIQMNTDVIDLPIQELVDMTNQFLDGFGILPNAATATSKSWVEKARDELPCIGCGDEPVLDDSFRHRDLVAKKKAGHGPNPKSSAKEIIGSHGHRSHGKSILWPALYEHLRAKGMSKAKAAAISNGQWNRRHGAKAKNATSTRFAKSATALADGVSDVLGLRADEQVGRLDAGSVVAGVADNGTIRDGSIVVLPHDSVPTPQGLGRRAPHAGVPAPGERPLPDEASVLGANGSSEQLLDGADPDHHLHPSGSGGTPGTGGGSRLSGEFRHAAMLQAGNKRHGKGASNLNNTRVTKSKEIAGEISKLDVDKQLVYGWMYVTHDRDGEVVVDKSGDFIDVVEELDEAVVDFVLHSRTGGVDHTRDGDSPVQASRLVESIVFTPEKVEALGLNPGDLPTGWWAGWKVDDPEVWEGVKSGKYKSFSIHGSGVREPYTAEVAKKEATPANKRRLAAAYTGKQVRGARSGSLTSKERKQRINAARASAAKRKGSGTKDKNPKTPETKARERTRIRTETPGTPEHTTALKRVGAALKSGKPLKVRQGELDSVIERAKAQGLKYEHNGDTVVVFLSDGRKLTVQSTQKESS